MRAEEATSMIFGFRPTSFTQMTKPACLAEAQFGVVVSQNKTIVRHNRRILNVEHGALALLGNESGAALPRPRHSASIREHLTIREGQNLPPRIRTSPLTYKPSLIDNTS